MGFGSHKIGVSKITFFTIIENIFTKKRNSYNKRGGINNTGGNVNLTSNVLPLHAGWPLVKQTFVIIYLLLHVILIC